MVVFLRALLCVCLARPAASAVVERVEAYHAGLSSYSPASAARFLSDSSAQNWMAQSQPEMLAPSLLRAHEIADLRALPARYDDPANLRRALIARDISPSSEKPADLKALYASWNLPDDQRLRVERALAEWRTLDPELRGWLKEAGVTAEAWKQLGLAHRAELVVAALTEHILQGRALTLDGRAYRERLLEFARRASPFMSASDDYGLEKTVDKHERLAADLRRARDAARRAQDTDLAAALGAAARTDPDTAQGVLDMLPGPDGATRPPVDVPPSVVRAVQKRLPDAVRRIVAGTPVEAVIGEALKRVVIDPLSTAQGGYEARRDRLVIGREHLDGFLAEHGRTAADLPSDPALLDAFALEIAPIVVHETTHRLQALRAREAGLDAYDQSLLYGHEDEREAYTVQLAFVRAYTAAHPARARALAENPRLDFFWSRRMIGKARKYVHVGYSNVPAFHGSRARAVTLALWRASDARRRLPAIETELSLAEDRPGSPIPELGGKLSSMSAAALREMRRAAEPLSELRLTKAYIAYLDAMDARLRAWGAPR
jgi:hypothetical protein